MLVSGEGGAALMDALDAARGVGRAGEGLVVVLLRGGEVAATLHWQVDGSVITTVDEVATWLGTDRAVLIVVGPLKSAGPIIAASDAVQARLSAAGLTVAAHVYVSALAEGAVAWKDLSDAARDGVSIPAALRDRPSGPFRFRRRR